MQRDGAATGNRFDLLLRQLAQFRVAIRRLRKALNDDGRSDVIRTVRAAGYSLDGAA